MTADDARTAAESISPANRRARLLDLFCCAGGAAEGYRRAGFEVVGVDINPQPEYPFEFHQGDALDYIRQHGHEFDAVHASPPCQAYTRLNALHPEAEYADLVEATREQLVALGVPWVIENVVGAPLLNPLTLCGSEFGLVDDGWWLKRHRLFESNLLLWSAGGCSCSGKPIAGIYGHSDGPVYRPGRKGWSVPSPKARRLLGTPWITNRHSLAQAIPPAYTEFVGRQLMAALQAQEVAA